VTGATRPPVTDFATDFDHTDPAWVTDPFPIWDDLRARCPVAHSERYGGVWLPTRHEDISAIAYDTEHFSSQGVVVSEVKPDVPAPMGGAPPITSDPPFHAFARRLLLPAFAPRPIAALEPATRQLCRDLLDAISAADHGGDPVLCDVAIDYAQGIPPAVIARMLGLPPEDDELFRGFIHDVLENLSAGDGEETRADRFEDLDTYLDRHIADHVAHPREDLISFLLDVEIEGAKLAPEHVRGTVVLLLIAGIDTTWSAIGAALWHLAAHPEDRHRLAAQPELMPVAVEELLRAYAPVTMARIVAEEVEVGGRSMSPGDWVLLPFPAANRDPDVFEDADRVVLDRAVNRHTSFGLGIHRCLGSNLARMELTVALEEWMARFPDFELADPQAVTWSSGQVRGPRSVPVRLLTCA
jgi:cytochrome P450